MKLYLVNDVERDALGFPSDKYLVAFWSESIGKWIVVYKDDTNVDEGAVDSGLECSEIRECNEIAVLIDALGSVDAAKEVLGS